MNGSRLSWWRTAAPHAAALLLSALLVVVVTDPLARHLRDHLINSTDSICFAWNNWWIYHALVELHGKPYFTSHVLVPFPIDLRLHTVGLFYGLVSLPFVPWLGAIPVVNLQILLTGMLNGYASFLLVRKCVGRADVAVLCGGVLAAVPAISFHLGAGRPSCAAIWSVILVQIFLMRLIDEPRWKNCLGLALWLIVLLAVDQQMPIFGGVFFFLYLSGVAVTRPRALFNRRIAGYGLVVLLLAAYPIRILYVRPFFQTPGYTTPDPGEALHYSVAPAQIFLHGGWWVGYGLLLPVGLLAAIALARTERRARLGVVCALFAFSLSLGPVISGTHIPMPFALLRHLPGLGMFRAPYRFQILTALGMALASAAALAYGLARLPPRAGLARGIVCGLILMAIADAFAYRWVYPLTTHAIVVEPIYHRLAATPGDFVLLEVPFGVRCGTDVIGRGDDLMLYQTVHHKRMINGYLSRVPYVALDYYRKSPAFMFLANEKPPPGDIAADLGERIRSLDIGFILVHPELLDKDRFDAILALLRQRTDLEPVPTGTTTLAFRVRSARAGD